MTPGHSLYMLNIHGFSDILEIISIPGDTFYNVFKLGVDGQFKDSLS